MVIAHIPLQLEEPDVRRVQSCAKHNAEAACNANPERAQLTSSSVRINCRKLRPLIFFLIKLRFCFSCSLFSLLLDVIHYLFNLFAHLTFPLNQIP